MASNQHSEHIELQAEDLGESFRKLIESAAHYNLRDDHMVSVSLELLRHLFEQNERQATNIGALYRQRRDAELACKLSREENTRLLEQLEMLQAEHTKLVESAFVETPLEPLADHQAAHREIVELKEQLETLRAQAATAEYDRNRANRAEEQNELLRSALLYLRDLSPMRSEHNLRYIDAALANVDGSNPAMEPKA